MTTGLSLADAVITALAMVYAACAVLAVAVLAAQLGAEARRAWRGEPVEFYHCTIPGLVLAIAGAIAWAALA